jgi:hypothetical protein
MFSGIAQLPDVTKCVICHGRTTRGTGRGRLLTSRAFGSIPCEIRGGQDGTASGFSPISPILLS